MPHPLSPRTDWPSMNADIQPGRADLAYPSRLWLLVFAFLLQTASLSQLPFLQENATAKVGLLLTEIAVFAMLVWTMRSAPGLWRWVAIAAVFVLVRFGYAWLIGYLRYESSFLGALQEGRFGLLIMVAPAAFLFFRTMPVRKLGELAIGLAAMLIVADLLVTWFFVRTGYLSLADRGAARYLLSVLPLVIVVWIRIVVSIRSQDPPRAVDLALLLLCMLHIVLFTTSRTEAILCAAVIGQWCYVRTPNLRWPLLLVVCVAGYLAYQLVQPTANEQIAGRNYRLALAYSRDAFPFGVGLVPEALQKIQLGTAGNFFASDYGPILLVYRYGVVGIAIGVAVLLFWLRFFLQTLVIPGTFVIAGATLIYLMIVPLLDYGSLLGGMMLGAMAAVMAASPRPDGRPAPAALPGRRFPLRGAYR